MSEHARLSIWIYIINRYIKIMFFKKLIFLFITTFFLVVTGVFSQPVHTMRPPIHVIHPLQPLSPLASPAGFSPSQIRAAYNLPTTGGTGTIAIIDAYDDTSAQNDFNVFSQQFGLLTATTTNFEIHKMSSTIALATTDNWALEISLDIEWSHAIAPNAKILLVEAVSPSDTDLLSAVQYAAGRSDVVAVSMSWGGNEFSGSNTYDSYFTSTHGVNFFASSGDSGTGVEWPAVSVNVTGVGGTQLTLSAQTTVTSEVAWSGSGGGLSKYVSEPSYQSTYGVPSANGFRAVPDVSYNGSSNSLYAVYDSLGESGWIEVYGTSAGSPQWAAIRALGGSLVNNTTFYSIAAIHSDYTTDFRDITSGSNGGSGFYTKATTGYDYVTGLGSPLTDNFSAVPLANFVGTPTTGNGPYTVNFTDSTLFYPTGWNWTFGDGSTSTSENPSHTYSAVTSPTYYTVQLIATNSYGTSTLIRTNYIFVTEPLPTPGFYGTPSSGTSPLTVNFADTSGNSPTAWLWQFGDGSTSNIQNPSHTYTSSSSATYSVTLIVSNSFGTTTSIKSNYIKITPPPVAGFFGTPTSGASPLTVNFTDTSANNPTGWQWNFGDGSTSTVQNPPHTYVSSTVATYTVRLIVTNSLGTSTSTLTNYIKVSPPPIAGFFGSPTSGISPLTVNFTDTSANIPTAWAWSFGDGSISNIQYPSHQYTVSTSASFTVTLIASNSFGANTAVYANYIQVTPPPPIAQFYGFPTSGTSPLIVNFTDTSLNNPTSWSWNFGDGSTASIQNPVHTYGIVSSPTSYAVQLIVSNSFGTSTLINSNYVTVLPPPPFAGFFGTPTSGYGVLTVNFTDTTANYPTGWIWSYGDGASTTIQNPQHIYSAVTTSVSYTVQLIATNSYGTTTSVRTNYIFVTEPPPTAGFSFSPLNGFGPLTVNFVDTSANNPTSWNWNFGDGAVTTIQNPSHIYGTVSTPTSFTIRFIVSNAFGTGTSTQTIPVTEPSPAAGFSGTPTGGNGPLTVNFTDTSINYYGSATSWNWNFGDGSTSNSQNPSHQYGVVGASTVYTVRLIVSTNFGTGTATQTNYISVTEPSPSAGFSASSTSGYGPLNVNFTDTSANLFGSSTAWSWDFGDGVSTTARNPQHTYSVVNIATTYSVRLIVSTNFGVSTSNQMISVTEPAPSAGFSGSPTSGTGPLTVNFTDTSANLFGASTVYAWNFGDGSTGNVRNPSHTYATVSSPTSYAVQLIVTTNFGISTSFIPNYITVAQLPPTAEFSASPLSGYGPLTVNFTDTSGFSPTAWAWDFGDGNTDNTQNPQHIYGTVTAPTTYSVRLIASNTFGSSTVTKNNFVSVSEPAPSIPNLLSPADSSALYRISVLFSWTTSTDIVNSSMNYSVQMARDTGFVSIVTTLSNLTVTNPTITGLPPGPLNWHVQATSVFGTSGYSSTQLVILFDTSDRQPVTSSQTAANFFIGDTTGVYLPVLMIFNTISPDTISITTFDTTAQGLPPGHFISRYWLINRVGNGPMNINLTFSYTSADFAASGLSLESSLYAVRDSTGPGGWSSVTTGITVDTVNHRLTVTGINQFSGGWTLGNLNAVPINDWWKYTQDMDIPRQP